MKCHLSFLASLITLAPQAAQEDKAGAELLAKIEEKFTKSKSIQFKCRIDMPSKEKLYYAAEGCIKRDKFKITLKTNFVKEEERTFICDGSQLSVTLKGSDPKVAQAPKGLAASVASAMARCGIVALVYLPEEPEKGYAETFPLSALKVSEEKVGERTCKVLSGELSIKTEDKGPMAIKVWMDPTTLAPVRRSIEGPKGKDSDLETWSEFAFDAEIKDEEFTIPKK